MIFQSSRCNVFIIANKVINATQYSKSFLPFCIVPCLSEYYVIFFIVFFFSVFFFFFMCQKCVCMCARVCWVYLFAFCTWFAWCECVLYTAFYYSIRMYWIVSQLPFFLSFTLSSLVRCWCLCCTCKKARTFSTPRASVETLCKSVVFHFLAFAYTAYIHTHRHTAVQFSCSVTHMWHRLVFHISGKL